MMAVDFVHDGSWLSAASSLMPAVALLVLGGVAAVLPENPPSPGPQTMLVEPGELQNKLNEKGLRILDTRPRPEYAKGHIPVAV
jgi:hypothetical protein